jgi:hypothetical protein
MGCNCKRGKKVINNLNSPDHISEAKIFFQSVKDKPIEEFDDFDKMESRRVYLSLYPNSNGVPQLEPMMGYIKTAIEIYDVKYRKS